jgi:hypothetical protein
MCTFSDRLPPLPPPSFHIPGFLNQKYGENSLQTFYKLFCGGKFKCGEDNNATAVTCKGDACAGSGGTESMLDIEYITAMGAGVKTEFWGFSGNNPYVSRGETGRDGERRGGAGRGAVPLFSLFSLRSILAPSGASPLRPTKCDHSMILIILTSCYTCTPHPRPSAPPPQVQQAERAVPQVALHGGQYIRRGRAQALLHELRGGRDSDPDQLAGPHQRRVSKGM